MEKPPKLVVICNGKSCRKYGADKLLTLLHHTPNLHCLVSTKFCFGHCGNGPMVYILPDDKIYDRVNEKKILELINKEDRG